MHSIRLRHPWQCQACNAGARWQRSFNWTAAINAGESVRLVIEGLPATATVQLNKQPLTGEGIFDITTALAPHNQLAIEIADTEPSNSTECPYDVRLEITAP